MHNNYPFAIQYFYKTHYVIICVHVDRLHWDVHTHTHTEIDELLKYRITGI